MIFHPEDFVLGFSNLLKLQINITSFNKTQRNHLFDLLGKKTRIKELIIETAVLFYDYTFLGLYDKDYFELL